LLALRIPADATTLAGFRAWVTSDDFPEKLRVTFIRGEIDIDMSKEEVQTHAAVKAQVCFVLMAINHEAKLGKFYLDGVLITNEAAEVSNNPDAVFLTRESLRTGRVRFIPRPKGEGQSVEVEGTPDWVMEIVSDSTVQKDTQRLRAAYHKAGIPEYWLIDARGEKIVFQILHWRKTGYVAAPNRDGWQRSRVFDRSFRLEREWDDDLKLWDYTLHLQPE